LLVIVVIVAIVVTDHGRCCLLSEISIRDWMREK
jgi:hypothetical protein